jgi:hypothetical protein
VQTSNVGMMDLGGHAGFAVLTRPAALLASANASMRHAIQVAVLRARYASMIHAALRIVQESSAEMMVAGVRVAAAGLTRRVVLTSFVRVLVFLVIRARHAAPLEIVMIWMLQ